MTALKKIFKDSDDSFWAEGRNLVLEWDVRCGLSTTRRGDGKHKKAALLRVGPERLLILPCVQHPPAPDNVQLAGRYTGSHSPPCSAASKCRPTVAIPKMAATKSASRSPVLARAANLNHKSPNLNPSARPSLNRGAVGQRYSQRRCTRRPTRAITCAALGLGGARVLR